MKKIKIAQIGIGHDHACEVVKSIKRQKDLFELVGYCAPDNEANDFKNNLQFFKDVREMTIKEILEYPGLDAVVIETEEKNLTQYATMACGRIPAVHMDKPGGMILEDFENFLDDDKNPVLCADFYMHALNCKDKGITWVGTVSSPKKVPEWLFNPEITSNAIPVKKMSEPEQSAVMSYFWAQNDRKDDTNHDRILDYMKDKNIQIYPPAYRYFAEDVIENYTSRRDAYHYKKGHYRASVITEDVIKALDRRYENNNYAEERNNLNDILDTLSNEQYIGRIQGKYAKNN